MHKWILFTLLFAISTAICADTTNSGFSLNTNQIEQLTGAKGQLDAKEQVFKVSVPRTDLSVSAQGIKITPAMGLTSWAAFYPMKNGQNMVMGDLVLLQDQVNPVMDVALANGLTITGLHNHFLWESPRIMFMHIAGMGDSAKLAQAIGKVFQQIKYISSESGDSVNFGIDPKNTTLDPHKIDAILNKTGTLKDGVYKVVIGKTTNMNETTIGSTMGVNTWAAFAGSDDNAVVDGDFTMHESELQNVIKALRAAHINIVAIHQHMINEQPRMMFLHFWGVGKTVDLAQGIKTALNETSSNK